MSLSNPPNSPDTPDQVDALDEILDATWAYGVDWTKFDDSPKKQIMYAAKIKADMKKNMKAKLSALLIEARLDELKKYDAFDDYEEADLYVMNRIKELEKQREVTE